MQKRKRGDLARAPVHRLLAKRELERQRLYQKLSPLYGKYGKGCGSKRARLLFAQAKDVAEEVARYTQNAKDQKWAKASVIIAAISPIPADMADDIRKTLLGFMPAKQTDALVNSFLCQDELCRLDGVPMSEKNIKRYVQLVRPYVSKEGHIELPPEVFARVVGLSQMSLEGLSRAEQENVAASILKVWRPAAIQLMLFKCYNQMSDIAAFVLYPQLFQLVDMLYRSIARELVDVRAKFGHYLDALMDGVVEIPLVRQTDRETMEQARYRIRIKTRGSTALKLIERGICQLTGEGFDPERVYTDIHDLVAGTLVTRGTHDAVNFYKFIMKNHANMVIEHEDIFYGRHSGNGNSLSGYKGVAHIDFDATRFGARNIRRAELHVRSYESYLAYYLSSRAGRGARDSQIIKDAWGDDNYKIVEALGNLEEHIDNGKPIVKRSLQGKNKKSPLKVAKPSHDARNREQKAGTRKPHASQKAADPKNPPKKKRRRKKR